MTVFLKKTCLVFSDVNLFPVENLENLNIFSTWSSHNELSHLIEKYKNNEEDLNKKIHIKIHLS